MRLPVYLDYLATTPVDPRVAARMAECLTIDGNFGNPASRTHVYGWRAEEAVEQARREVADLIGADPREIVWTSGATEADNLALKGVAGHRGRREGHIVIPAIEHSAVLDTCRHLESQGFALSLVAPDRGGIVRPEALAPLLREDTFLVSVMHVNNELGTINDIAAIGALCRERGIVFHVDAAQSAGKLPIDLGQWPVDLMSLSAHKMYGPKGVGALFIDGTTLRRVAPLFHGGGQERGLRPGTLATHQLLGMGLAAELARTRLGTDRCGQTSLRDALWMALARVPGVLLNGHPLRRSCHIVNVSVEGVDGESLLLALETLAVSSGAACASASGEPSPVLRRLGRSDALAQSSIRFSLGRGTTAAEIEAAAAIFAAGVAHLRRLAPPAVA